MSLYKRNIGWLKRPSNILYNMNLVLYGITGRVRSINMATVVCTVTTVIHFVVSFVLDITLFFLCDFRIMALLLMNFLSFCSTITSMHSCNIPSIYSWSIDPSIYSGVFITPSIYSWSIDPYFIPGVLLLQYIPRVLILQYIPRVLFL